MHYIKHIILVIGLLVSYHTMAQVVNPAMLDTADVALPGKITYSAYLDAYYAYDGVAERSFNQSYGVSYDQEHEFTINLAYIDLKYSGHNMRARIVPAFGTYMNANYSAESIKYLLEASAGFKVWAERNIWIDAGIIGSPYTNESAISRDHLMLTRSLASEYVPYYLSGIKIGGPLTSKINLYGYVLNGWQNIKETNKQKSFGTQVEYRPNTNLLINWNTYVGYEEGQGLQSQFRDRYFTDAYFVYESGRISATGCFYVGRQHIQESSDLKVVYWYNANLIGRYKWSDHVSTSARLEWFYDDGGAVSVNNTVRFAPVGSIPSMTGLKTYATSVACNYSFNKYLLIRAEVKQLFGPWANHIGGDLTPVYGNTLAVVGLNVLF